MTTSGSIELRGGRVIDVIEGQVLEQGTRLVLEDGRVSAMPGLGGQPDREGDRVIDLGGRRVIPGMINTHAHVTLPIPGPLLSAREARAAKRHGRRQVTKSLADCLDRGVTCVRDTLCEDLRRLERLEQGISSGELSGPRLIRSVVVGRLGGVFTEPRRVSERVVLPMLGFPALEHHDPASGTLAFAPDADERAVRNTVDQAIDERGAATIKVYEQRERKLTYHPGAPVMSQQQLDALADQARRRGVSTTIHHTSVESFRRAVRAGIVTLAHHPLDGPLTLEDARAMRDAGVMIEPTATLAFYYCFARELGRTQQRLAALDEARQRQAEVLVTRDWIEPLRPTVLASMRRAAMGKRRAFGLFDVSPVFRYYSRVLTQGFDNLLLLWEVAGADRFTFGNDAGPNPCGPAAIGLELELLDLCLRERDGAGLRPVDALRLVTHNGAHALGLGDRLGRIEPGAEADLVVLDGDPLTDWRALGRPAAAVFRAGELVVDRCGLDLSGSSQEDEDRVKS